MNSKTLPSFWKCFEKLPAEIQDLARQKYRLWRSNPFHASLHFKEVRPRVWSVRISQKYRALGRKEQIDFESRWPRLSPCAVKRQLEPPPIGCPRKLSQIP